MSESKWATNLRIAAEEMRQEDQPGWPVTCDAAADLIERQAKAIEWALAQIEGRTRYDRDEQYENCVSELRALTKQ